jgi:hypothetical protein
MPQAARQEKIIPIDFRGHQYKAHVEIGPGVCIIKKTTMRGYPVPMRTVLAPHCLDALIAKHGFGA